MGCLLILVGKKPSWSFAKTAMLPIMWVLWPLSLTFRVHDPSVHLTHISTTVFYGVVMAIVVSGWSGDKIRSGSTIAWISTSWAVLNTGLLLMNLLPVGGKPTGDFSGIVYNRNVLSITSIVLIWLLRSPVLELPRWFRKIRRIVDLLLGAIAISSLSIKGALGLFLILFGFRWLQASRRTRVSYSAGALAFLIALFLIPSPIQRRLVRFSYAITQPEELRVGESAFLRSWFIIESLRITVRHPMTGVGVANSRYYLWSPHHQLLEDQGRIVRSAGTTYSHNNYTEMLLSGGVPALLLYYGPLLWAIAITRRVKRQARSGLADSNDVLLANHVLIGLVLKLFWDIAMVSYNSPVHALVYAAAVFTAMLLNARTPSFRPSRIIRLND
jgi:hypothetical protein